MAPPVRPPQRRLTMTLTETSSCTLPNELVSHILSDTLAYSIHRLCMSDGDVDWERRIAFILSSVCFSFREITRELLQKVFSIDPQDPRWPEKVQDTFTLLRDITLSRRGSIGTPGCPPSSTVHINFRQRSLTTPFLDAYALFLTSLALRTNVISNPTVFLATEAIMLSSLGRARDVALKVTPRRIARKLIEGIDTEVVFVHTISTLVKAPNELKQCLEDMDRQLASSIAEDERQITLAAIKLKMSEALTSLEHCCRGSLECHRDAIGVMGSLKTFIKMEPCITFKLSNINSILSQVPYAHALTGPFTLDEHDLRQRATDLLAMWPSDEDGDAVMEPSTL